tara:strand:- start:949 stop:2142 length:1194 start_codon:yes stop_codon:yes gene_type:complete
MNDKFESEPFQLPTELQNVPSNYTMSHITYEDVNGILSLVEIALARGSIKGDELAILNQIRNDCLQEVQDYQAWVQKRQQVMAVEQQIENEKKKAEQAKEIESIKATADAKVQAAQDASRILQNRVNELENQAKARGITPVNSEHSDEELNVAMKPVNMGAPSKSWENARAQNPVPTITNQPTEPVTVEEEIDNISSQMQNAWDNIDVEVEFDEPNLDVSVNVPEVDNLDYNSQEADEVSASEAVKPMFEIKMGQDGNVPLGQQVTEEDVNMNVTKFEDDFEPIQGDGEVEIELQEDPESIADVQAMKEAVEEEYEEVVIPNSMELQKMTKAKIKEVADSIGITVSDNQTKSAMIKDFEEESWNLIKEAEESENATVHTDEDIIRDGGYFGDDNDSK